MNKRMLILAITLTLFTSNRLNYAIKMNIKTESLEQIKNNYTKQVKRLKTDMQPLKTQVQSLKTELATIKAQHKNLEKEQKSLNLNKKTLEEKIDGMMPEFPDPSEEDIERWESQKNEVERELTEINAKIEEKGRIITEKMNLIGEKEELIKEKERQIKEKEKLTILINRELRGRKEIMTAAEKSGQRSWLTATGLFLKYTSGLEREMDDNKKEITKLRKDSRNIFKRKITRERAKKDLKEKEARFLFMARELSRRLQIGRKWYR